MTSDLPDLPGETVPVESDEILVKVVGMLQQNWAMLDRSADGAVVWFVDDASGVFDRLSFPTRSTAHEALRRNGFEAFTEDSVHAGVLSPPPPPFRRSAHPGGRIYSEGRFWTP